MGVFHRSCPGYASEPFATLVAQYPGGDVYPPGDFRTEWGPIFHRGRLDGSARVLVLGQDPAAHESVTRRILVGVAGQRVQGLLAKVGITTSYAMVNVYVYSVFGQSAGNHHAQDAAIAAYRHRWLDALLVGTDVTAVVALGDLAARAYRTWAKTRPDASGHLHVAAVRHPTYADAVARATGRPVAETTAEQLANWNAALPGITGHVEADVPTPLVPYGDAWATGDLVPIPEQDLPPGTPPWWRDLEPWAARTGDTAQAKRATLTVTVPEGARTWPAL